MKTKTSGFALTELLVVIAIISVMTAIAAAKMNSSDKARTALKAEARSLLALIKSQQNDALAGKNASTSCNNEYKVSAVKDAASYTISGCDNLPLKTLPSGMTFKQDASVSFFAPDANIKSNGTQLAKDDAVYFTLTKSGQEYSIAVYGSGRITEGETP